MTNSEKANVRSESPGMNMIRFNLKKKEKGIPDRENGRCRGIKFKINTFEKQS